MEKRISVFIGRTNFITSEKLSYQHFDWLLFFLGYWLYLVFLRRSYCHFAHNTAAVLGKARKVINGFYVKKKKSFSKKNMERNEE